METCSVSAVYYYLYETWDRVSLTADTDFDYQSSLSVFFVLFLFVYFVFSSFFITSFIFYYFSIVLFSFLSVILSLFFLSFSFD